MNVVSGIRLKSDVSMQEAGAGEDSFVPAEGVFVALGTAGRLGDGPPDRRGAE